MAETIDPVVNDLNRPFWEGAARNELRLPHCAGTGRPFWPPSPTSPFDGGAVSWRGVPAEGLLTTTVTYARVFQQALAANMPYAVAQVELDGGVRLLAHVRDPQAVRPGDKVGLSFAPLVEGAMPVLVVGGAPVSR